MTVTDQIKIIDNKVKTNQAQYDLDRLTAKISALPSGELRKYEYLTGEDLGYRPSVLEQTKFDCSPLGKMFNRGLAKDDKEKGLFKRLKHIENAQKSLINGNNKNKPDSAMSKLSLPRIFDSISSKSKDKDEDENEKAERELYLDGIEGMKGLKLPGDSKDEKSQMYLEDNLNKIKNNSPDIYDKYQRFFKYIANKEKNDVNYKMLSSKVDDINFYDRYGTLYNWLNYFPKFISEEISIKNKSFLGNLSKGFKLESVYSTGGKNNTENAFDDLVLNNKKIDNVLYKKPNNELSDRNKNIFQEAKNLFDLRVEFIKHCSLKKKIQSLKKVLEKQ